MDNARWREETRETIKGKEATMKKSEEMKKKGWKKFVRKKGGKKI